MSPTDLIGFAIGCTLTSLGFASIGAWGLRQRAAGRLVLIFGIWCVLYGVRLVASLPGVRVSIGLENRGWLYVVILITYVINIPTALFFEALIGPGWKQSVRRVRQLQMAYAAVAIGAWLVTGRPTAAMPLNNPLVVASLSINALNAWWYRRRLGYLFRTPLISIGAFALLFFVINENLGRPLLPAVNLEPVGVLAFMITLAYGVVGSVVRGEAELVAVQRELETARDIQRSLLPREAPHARGLDVAVQYVPMTAVAGDLYDFVDLGESKVGILVADVSGHGIPAALVASMVKLAFSSQADHAHDPAHVLTAVNRALSRQLEHGFVTAIYAVIDTERGVITVANAGHPPLLIGRSDKSVVEVHEHGMVLGFLPQASYTNAEIALRAGDLIFLYTDGVLEARNARDEFFDGERVRSWLTSASGDGMERFGERALADLKQWTGHITFDDDVTFVVARFSAAAR